MPSSGNSNSQIDNNESAMASDSAINYQNILLDNLDKPTDTTFNSPVTKRKTNFTTDDPHIKKHDQTALDYLKCQILTEVTQEINKCNISKCNKSSTPNKSHTQTLESEINFLRSEMQGKKMP